MFNILFNFVFDSYFELVQKINCIQMKLLNYYYLRAISYIIMDLVIM